MFRKKSDTLWKRITHQCTDRCTYARSPPAFGVGWLMKMSRRPTGWPGSGPVCLSVSLSVGLLKKLEWLFRVGKVA